MKLAGATATTHAGQNPCSKVKAPKVKAKKPRWLQPEQVQALLAVVADEPASVRAFVTLLVCSGARGAARTPR